MIAMNKALILSERPLLSRKEEKALAEAGVEVTVLTRLSEDLLKKGSDDYDIIVIDDSLHGGDIFEACRQLRDATTAYIILLGNMPSWEMWDKGGEIGFDRYYKKPVQPKELATKIKHAAYEREYKTKTPPVKRSEKTDAVATGESVNTKAQAKQAEQVPAPANTAEEPCRPDPGTEAPPKKAANIWEDPKVAELISRLLNGKITRLSPVIDLGLADGFSYREADAAMGTTGRETARILESLEKEGLLLKQDGDRILLSPAGSMQLVPVERCPQCDSPDLNRGQLIEHFSCGYIGLEEEFNKGHNQVCPKCKRELKLIGTDYRKPGMRYVCNSCHGVFPSPVIKCRDLPTGKVYPLEELGYLTLYSYRLNGAHKQRLEFEIEPKRQLIDCLTHLGYEVKEAVQVQGRSGAVHTIDLVASIDDLLTRHVVAIGILAAPRDESAVSIDALFSFDSKAYDAGINNKMVIAVPGFTSEAMKFAERQGIRVYRLEDLRALLGWKIQETEIIAVKKEKDTETCGPTDLTKLGPRGWLRWLLEKRGYHVAEKLKMAGRSGAEHVLDMYAEKDDGIVNHKLAACVIMNKEGSPNDVNEVIKFDAAAYDARIRDKIIISVPRLSKEARPFAEYQRIKVLEAKELADFSDRCEADDAARRFSTLLSNS
jgi:DNA-binding NarL/FixJ family response regulator